MGAPSPPLGPRAPFILDHLPVRRRRDGLVLVEGSRLAAEAFAGSWPLEALVVVSGQEDSPDHRPLLRQAEALRLAVRFVDSRAMAKLSEAPSPPAVAVLLHLPNLQPGEFPPRLLILDGVADPGNAGTLIRTAAAFGASVILVGGVRLHNEKLIRSTAGTCFHRGVVLGEAERHDLMEKLRADGRPIWLLEPEARESLREVSAKGAFALVVGNEAAGVDRSLWPTAQGLRIPMLAAVESLNASISGAIALYELCR